MKHLNLVILCLGFAAVLQAQKVKTIETDTIVNGAYQHLDKSTFTYDANCFLITTLDQSWNVNTSTYLDAFLITYTNNSNGTVNQAVFQSNNNGNWVNLLRFSYTYTSFQKVSTLSTDFWLVNKWQAQSITNYSYDANNYLSHDSSTSLFIIINPSLKNIYTNNSDGSPKQIISQSWNVNTWQNAARTSITYYNNNPQKTLTTKTEIASGNNWINSDSTTYTYNGNGVATSSLEQTWDNGSSSWKNYKKNNFSYNGDGTLNNVITQNWNGAAWIDYERSTSTYTTNCLLPLTLLNFNAVKQNNKVQLSWKTANEINTSHFSIQRSVNAVNFTTIGTVNAAGSSSVQMSYGFTDDISQLKTNKVYYRLQQEDKDGKITLSNIVVVSVTAGTAQFIMLPNPARNYFTIIPNGNTDLNNATVTISGITGKVLIKQKLNNSGQQQVNISALPKGMYLVNIITSGNVQTQKLVVE